MSKYDFEKKGVKVTEDGDLMLKIEINSSAYMVPAQSGTRAKRTQRMVKRLLGPGMARAQGLYDKAYKSMSPQDKADIKIFQQLLKDKAPGHEDAADQINKIVEKSIETEDFEKMMVSAYDTISPDDEEALDFALFDNVESIEHGRLGDAANYNKHFIRQRLKHVDILRDVVIEYNDFLDLKESQA